MIRHILVVCVGNICRSPMAEALLRDALREQQDITVESAGLGALVDHPASEHAVTLMRERGLDISGHRARQITPDMVHAADLVLVRPDGAIEIAATDLEFPNGSVITPDGRTLIVGESMGRRYTAFTVADDASLSDRRVWAPVEGRAPDGCVLDAEGAIWMADALGSGCHRVAEGGRAVAILAHGDGAQLRGHRQDAWRRRQPAKGHRHRRRRRRLQPAHW